jgi:diketogulonate reductase-like aldo/keto reductase
MISLENSVDEVINGFYKSLESLGQKQVEGLLVHDMNNIENEQFDALFSKLNELKQQGLIEKIGFSTYMPEQVDFLLENLIILVIIW